MAHLCAEICYYSESLQIAAATHPHRAIPYAVLLYQGGSSVCNKSWPDVLMMFLQTNHEPCYTAHQTIRFATCTGQGTHCCFRVYTRIQMFDVWHCRQPLAASQCSYISENCQSRQGKTFTGTCDGVVTLQALSVLALRQRALGQSAAHQRSAENCKHAKEVSQSHFWFLHVFVSPPHACRESNVPVKV